jgi:hypothetical protein
MTAASMPRDYRGSAFQRRPLSARDKALMAKGKTKKRVQQIIWRLDSATTPDGDAAQPPGTQADG